MPETVELLFAGFLEVPQLLRKLADTADENYSLAEHSANVMMFSMNYGIYAGYSEDDTKRLSLGGLLHDIGKTQLPNTVVFADHRLSDEEFSLYQTHASIGHDLIKQTEKFHPSIARGALEHHERLDGSGYPRGISNVSIEGQIMGIIDDFEYLSFWEKSYRKAKKPFDAMSVIRKEVREEGKFDKEIFVNFCKSMG